MSFREKFIENWGDDITKMTLSRKIDIEKKPEIWFFFWFSRFCIFQVNFTTFKFFLLPMHAKQWRDILRNMPLTLTCSDLGTPILKKIPSPWMHFGGGWSLPPPKKKIKNVWTEKNSQFFLKLSNLHETCGIGWIERKIKFQIFIFRVMVIFGPFFFSEKISVGPECGPTEYLAPDSC